MKTSTLFFAIAVGLMIGISLLMLDNENKKEIRLLKQVCMKVIYERDSLQKILSDQSIIDTISIKNDSSKWVYVRFHVTVH